MNVSQPDQAKRLARGGCSGDQVTLVKRTQVEATIKPKNRSCQSFFNAKARREEDRGEKPGHPIVSQDFSVRLCGLSLVSAMKRVLLVQQSGGGA